MVAGYSRRVPDPRRPDNTIWEFRCENLKIILYFLILNTLLPVKCECFFKNLLGSHRAVDLIKALAREFPDLIFAMETHPEKVAMTSLGFASLVLTAVPLIIFFGFFFKIHLRLIFQDVYTLASAFLNKVLTDSFFLFNNRKKT
jgi:hypothetical protein